MSKASPKSKKNRTVKPVRVAYFVLADAINAKKAAEVHEAVLSLAGEVDRLIVRICSPGGDVECGMAIYDALCHFPGEVWTEAWGEAYSIAALILQAGEKRFAAPNARIMIHNVKVMLRGGATSEELRKTRNNMDFLNNRYIQLLAERSGLKSEHLAQMMDEETFFSPKEALQLGLIDEVLKKK